VTNAQSSSYACMEPPSSSITRRHDRSMPSTSLGGLLHCGNPSIQFELASDERWDLTGSGGVALRDKIRDRAQTLARSIAAQERGES
jgi:hypothetical protein